MKFYINAVLILLMISALYTIKVNDKVGESLFKEIKSKISYDADTKAKIRASCPAFGKKGGKQYCDETFRRNKNGLCKWNGNSCVSLI